MKTEIRTDDRTQDERLTHTILISCYDPIMSRWPTMAKFRSYAVWACRPEDADTVFKWVKNRSDMKRVKFHDNGIFFPKGRSHVHVYVVRDGHPAIRQEKVV